MKKNIVITILAVLVVGLGCFIVYDKVIDKDENKDNNVIESNETKDNKDGTNMSVNDKVVANQLLSLMSIGPCGGAYTYDINVGDTIYYDQLPDEVKFSVAYKNAFGKAHLDEVSPNLILDSYNEIFGNKNYSLPQKISTLYNFLSYELTKEELTNRDIYKLVASGGGCSIDGASTYSLGDITVTQNGISFEVKDDDRSYIFSFVLDNDHYIFDSIKRIK